MNPIKSAGLMAYRLSEVYHDWRLGIATQGLVVPADFGAQAQGCHPYLALSYSSLRRVLQNMQVRADQDVLIDYGSGMGRVVIAAAALPFRKVVGVELSKGLHDAAVQNVERARPKLRCKNVELHLGDARDYPVPADASIIYFFMPFDAEILEAVLRKIHGSILAAPRQVTILYVYPQTGVNLHAVLPKLPWLKLQSESHVESTLHLMVATIDASGK